MAGLACAFPVFDELLGSDQPKDTEVIIVEEGSSTAAGTSTDSGQEAGRKRSKPDTPESSITLAAHWVVLYSLSPYFKTKIERWSRAEHANKRQRQQQLDTRQPDQQQVAQQQASPDHAQQVDQQQASPDHAQQVAQQQASPDHAQQADQQQEAPPAYQYSLQLLVPPGQLELGRRLITAMYSSSPDLSDLTAPQLMQLVALAECYGVGKVAAAIAAHLQQLTVKSMPLDTAAAVFELPEACLALPAFYPVWWTAANKLQQELGDLEVVWGDEGKQAALLGLPFEAVLQLLRDERTRVAGGSEDTVVYTAAAWLANHPEAASKAPQLLAVLRLPHCTATYLTSSYVRKYLAAWGVTEEQLNDLAAMPALTAQQRTGWLEDAYGQQQAWQMPRRPASAIDALRLDARLQLAAVKAALEEDPEEDPQGSAGTWRVPAQWLVWHGRAWDCGVYANTEGSLGPYLQVKPFRACCDVKIELAGRYPDSRSAWELPGVYVADMMPGSLQCEVLEGSKDAGPVVTWAQLRGRLEERDLVHAGDALHLSCTVSGVA